MSVHRWLCLGDWKGRGHWDTANPLTLQVLGWRGWWLLLWALAGDFPAGSGTHGHPDRLWDELPGQEGGHPQRPGCKELCVSTVPSAAAAPRTQPQLSFKMHIWGRWCSQWSYFPPKQGEPEIMVLKDAERPLCNCFSWVCLSLFQRLEKK